MLRVYVELWGVEITDTSHELLNMNMMSTTNLEYVRSWRVEINNIVCVVTYEYDERGSMILK